MDIRVKILSENATIPTYGSEHSACCDLYAAQEVTLPPESTAVVRTGLSFEPPKGYYGAIYARSGLATKQGLRPANCVGICDEDYRGEYMVAMHNDSHEEKVIQVGDRIAQLIFVPYEQAQFAVVDQLEETQRGAGGFGSTGK